ncbi:NADPH-dependent FMN reductase [Luteipulveratus halotolerans]|uniref:NADPH-dependent FMN reductase n=1 Tax=Luteipulveratus halotolerans TaxID=1631356 RepID=A0A0L6CFE7_9MICO|nr:NADPH-dependent FMN reductase [Luteipulveratus halotolerans]KNX36536.1 NADPH-dependent FMN reductase [Luteipulveratus halotolerans]
MARIAAISSSPSSTSRTDAVLGTVTDSLTRTGHSISPIVLRDLPADALLRADTNDADVAHAVQTLTSSDAVIVTTPVYKASFGGLLKVFLDLPQYALQGKAVLPLATGGTPAHVLVVDYALRPVLSSLGATHITPGWFVLSQHVAIDADGAVTVDDASGAPLREVTDGFAQAIARLDPVVRQHVAVA